MLLSRSFEKKKSICRIDLIQHKDNDKYASEMLFTRPDGH